MNEKDKVQIDWQQVALNGGPPCFFVEGPQYCGRAERWPGHGNEAFHKFVSLDDLLATARKVAVLQAARDVCMYCGGRALAFFPAVDGPNEAGNFTHQHRTDKEARALCKASAIYARLVAATTDKENSDATD